MPDRMAQRDFIRSLIILLCAIGFTSRSCGAAQASASGSQAAGSTAPQQGIYLVFPFENAGASPRLDWLGEGLEELTIQRLFAAGQQVYSHAGRASEMDRYGLPANAKLSRAAMLHIADDLDADFVIFGSFASDGQNLTVESRILRVNVMSDHTATNAKALLAPARESGPLNSLMDLHLRLVWRLISANDPSYRLNLAEFSKAQRPLRLDAFEHYIRGLLASEDEGRLRELREAARLEPDWPDPDFALGQAYYLRRDCNSAIPWFARVPNSHQRHFEAIFATGVCRLLLSQPDRAEEVFAALQTAPKNNSAGEGGAGNAISSVEMPEILNDLAIAQVRQGKIPPALERLRRATQLDPDEDDYPFNLGLLALRAKDFAGAADYFHEASQRSPENPEDRAMLILSLEKGGKKEEADQERGLAKEALGNDALPKIQLEPSPKPRAKTRNKSRKKEQPQPEEQGDALTRYERLKTQLDTIALRLEIETPEPVSGVAANDFAADTPANHVRRGRQELAGNLLDAAEFEFRTALKAEPNDASAHQGLAEIDRRRGKLDDAVKELQASLVTRDSAIVHTALAKVYLEQTKPDLARAEAEHALKLAPNYSEAKQLLAHLKNTKPGSSKP
jgi:tetratricopeptide (TPR) repeat protein